MVDAFKGVPYSFSALRKTFGRSRAPPSAASGGRPDRWRAARPQGRPQTLGCGVRRQRRHDKRVVSRGALQLKRVFPGAALHPGSTSSGVFSGIEPVAADVGLGLGAVRMTATWEAVRTLHADSELVVLTKARRRWPRSKIC